MASEETADSSRDPEASPLVPRTRRQQRRSVLRLSAASVAAVLLMTVALAARAPAAGAAGPARGSGAVHALDGAMTLKAAAATPALAGPAALDHVARDARRVAAGPPGGLTRALRSTDGHGDTEAHGEDHHNAESTTKTASGEGGTDDDDDHHSAEFKAKTASGEGGKDDDDETVVYDKSGGHLEEDFVSAALRPQELQPYYLMPIFFGIKITLTMSIFGFSIRFKKDVVAAMLKRDGFCATRTTHGFLRTVGSYDIVKNMKEVVKFMCQLGFFAMACNGFQHDFQFYTQATKDMDGFFKRMCCLVVIVETSANYVAARALGLQVTFESPVMLLGLRKVRYRCIPQIPGVPSGLPLIPGGAKWFPCQKHLYFLLLSPYLILNVFFGVAWMLFLQVLLKVLRYVFSLCPKIIGCILLLHFCGTVIIGCIVSFGLWAWAKESFGYWWSLIAPFFYFSLMQIWATLVAPIVFSVFYGFVNRMKWEQIKKGLVEDFHPAATQAQDTVASGSAGLMEQPLADQEDRTPAATQAQDTVASGSAGLMEQPLADQEDRTPLATQAQDTVASRSARVREQPLALADPEDRIRLINLNRTELEKDFSDVPVSENALEDDTKDDTEDSLDDTKMRIFFMTMVQMSFITVEQMVLISLVRIIFCSGSWEAYVGSYQLTIGERHWYTYYGNVAKLAERGIVSATNAIWMLV
ncbi:unnamed protein product [Prorocentrum cordatum]|uniref:Uncharacterized protein n=1 Tax=Prorocentrum cordatum TaxID=2364126 RepID=A0ABN9TMW9_9DINO|nr:unnamed protein product [Polarella glacialis]